VDIQALTDATISDLSAAADPKKAGLMASYMKTDMPFYGVHKAGRTSVLRRLRREFSPGDANEYRAAVLGLWQLEHREEKYLALGYARAFDVFVNGESMALYERLVTEGAWWDFVDEAATKLIGRVLSEERTATELIVRQWIRSDDMWLRRTSIICQLAHKEDTDTALLSDACIANLTDIEFFIRKAIGWALREYAKTDPDWVRAFVKTHRDELSGLSYREATKHL